MKNAVQKIRGNVTLTNLLQVEKINRLFGKEFSIHLQRADYYYKASENYKLQETKDELKKLNIEFKDKYDYFLQFFGTKKTQSALLIKIGSIDKVIIADYLKENLYPTLEKLSEFIKVDKDINLTAEGISEESKKEKPKKFTTDKKGIEIKINSGITAEDIKQALEYLNTLMVTPTTNVA